MPAWNTVGVMKLSRILPVPGAALGQVKCAVAYLPTRLGGLEAVRIIKTEPMIHCAPATATGRGGYSGLGVSRRARATILFIQSIIPVA